MTRVARALAVLLVGASVCAASCAPERPIEREGGTITVLVPAEFAHIDPHRAPSATPLTEALYDTLLVRDAALAVKPALATAWTVSADGLRITLRLRDGVSFHDGGAVDARAVGANLARVLAGDPDEFPVRRLLGPVNAIEADGQLLTLVYDQPFPAVWRALADGRLAIVSPASLVNLDAAAASGGHPVAPVAGSGPYRLHTTNGSVFELERNDTYSWSPATAHNRGPVYPARYRIVAYAAGQIGSEAAELHPDVLWWPPGLALPAELEIMTAGWRRHQFAGTRITYLAVVTTAEPLRAVAVRMALGLVVDRGVLVDLLPGPAAPTRWPFSVNVVPEPAGADRQAKDDLDVAMELLEGAGWLAGESGVRQRAGLTLAVRLATYDSGDAPEFAVLAQELARQWATVGIACQIVPARRPAAPGAAANAPDIWLLYHDWYDPDIAYYLFHSSEVGRANRTGIVDLHLDQLLEQGRAQLDPSLRLQTYQDVATLLVENAVVVPLVQHVGVLRVSPRVVGLSQPAPGSFPPHDLYLRDAPGR